MMKNITKEIKEAISANALWSVSDFFYFIEMLNNKGYETSYWEGEEYWVTLLHSGIRIGYIWQKYPLIFIKEDHAEDMRAKPDFEIASKNLAAARHVQTTPPMFFNSTL